MSATKQINVRLPLELHKALDDHRVRTGEPKSDAIRRGVTLALERSAPPTTADDSVDLTVWLADRTGMPRTLCWNRIRAGRVTVEGHAWRENCVSKSQLDSIRLDGEPV